MTNKDVWDVEKEKSSFIYFIYLFVCLSFFQSNIYNWIYNFYFGSF